MEILSTEGLLTEDEVMSRLILAGFIEHVVRNGVSYYKPLTGDLFPQLPATPAKPKRKRAQKQSGTGFASNKPDTDGTVYSQATSGGKSGHGKTLYPALVELWFIHYEKATGIKPHFSAKEAAQLKKLIGALQSTHKAKFAADATDDDVLKSFEYILTKWHTLPSWYIQNLSITTIYSKFNEIVNQLKNGHGKQPAGAAVTAAGLDAAISEFYRKR